ncbi:MAG: hypothetical protein HQL38_14410 [Alphaproteobacteria bacterium]|nr:hypothetical protein [Alphaproteobacteria bacterium]MBF0335615.1 hypothetical protein [Alphaproteobacteria bacterium]MBF0393867.1 hypothetical protein [Alphaproteobacteria bacterium]
MTSLPLDRMERFQEIFDALRGGRHLSSDNEDAALWHAWRGHKEAWSALFAAMGLRLVDDPAGFCFLAREDVTSTAVPKMAVFMLVLIRHLCDADQDPEAALLEGVFAVADLPHLAKERHRQWLALVEIRTVENLQSVVQSLIRLGFARPVGADRFRFCLPVLRFVALCQEALRDAMVDVEEASP